MNFYYESTTVMPDWSFPKGNPWTRPVYAGNASDADRMFGAPCGCVYLVRRYVELGKRAGKEVPTEPLSVCLKCQGLQSTEVSDLLESLAATVYHYSPQLNERDLPWQ